MPTFPKTLLDLYSLSDIGRRLVDPGPAYEALQFMFGWQTILATQYPPGPLASMAVNVLNGPALGTGNNLWVMLPLALAGRSLQIVNLAGSTVNVNTQPYNPGAGRPDQLIHGSTGIPLGIGSVTTFLAYEPGTWLLSYTSAESATPPPPPPEE